MYSVLLPDPEYTSRELTSMCGKGPARAVFGGEASALGTLNVQPPTAPEERIDPVGLLSVTVFAAVPSGKTKLGDALANGVKAKASKPSNALRPVFMVCPPTSFFSTPRLADIHRQKQTRLCHCQSRIISL